MDGNESTDGESYEERIKRMQRLEVELAQERAKLQELQHQRTIDAGVGTSPPVRSVIPEDDLEDLHSSKGGYSENLMLPDDDLDPEISQRPHISLPSLTQEISLEPEPSIEIDDAQDGSSAESIEIQEYRREIDRFRDRGYNVSRMYSVFNDDIDTIRSSIVQIMEEVNQLKEIERQLDVMDVTGFENDAESLRTLLMNPEMVENARTFFMGLKERIDTQESRERTQRLREVEDLFEDTVNEFSDVIGAFEDQIQDIKVAIIDMDTAPVNEFRNIKKMIFDLKDAMIQEKLVKEKANEKRSLHEDLNEWKRKGFSVSEIEAVMAQDLKKAVELYGEFFVKANRLLELNAELNTIDVAGFDSEKREIRGIITDTEKIILAENKMKSLKRRIRLSGIQTKMDRLRTPASSKRTGPTKMTCPKCGGVVPIPSDERPLKVNCSSCSTEFHLKRIPSPPPASTNEGIPVDPIQDGSSVPIEVAPISQDQPQTGPQPGPAPMEAQVVQPMAPSHPSHQIPPTHQIPSPHQIPPPHQIPSPHQIPPPQPKCPSCGADLLPDSVFCGLCGHRME